MAHDSYSLHRMNSDAYFVTGKSHEICQDYAWAPTLPDLIPLAIVSDGCSSSPHTDFGSRLLCHGLKNVLDKALDQPQRRTIIRAEVQAEAIGLPTESLDATLLYIEPREKNIHIHMSGDGVMAFRDLEGNLDIWNFSHWRGAPTYLSYSLDESRFARYKEEYGTTMKITHWRIAPDGSILDESNETAYGQDDKYGQSFIKGYDECDLLAVFSDGVGTFRDSSMNYKEIPLIISELMGIKTSKGKFVQRRMKRFLKNCDKLGIHPDDDVSMAALYIKQEKKKNDSR